MFENSPKKAIRDVASLPAVGDAKTIYRVTSTGHHYVFNDVENTYKKLPGSLFYVGGTNLSADDDSKTLDVFRVGKQGITDSPFPDSNFSPRYAYDVFNTSGNSFIGVSIAGDDPGIESGFIVQTKDNGTDSLKSVSTKGWKIFGKADSASEGANNLFINYWNGVTWLSSMQFYASTGSVVVGSPSPTYSPANSFEVWGDAKFSAKIEDAVGSYGTVGQVLSSNGTAGGVRWATPTTGLVGIHGLGQIKSGSTITLAVNATALASVTTVASTLSVSPFIPTKSFTNVSFSINVTTLLAGGNARVLIYSDTDGEPGTKLFESSNMSTASTGVKTVSETFAFVAGTTYWIGLHVNGVITFTALASASMMVCKTITPLNSNRALISAALGSAPATFGTPTYGLASVPAIFINI